MSQQSVIFAALFIGFVVYITARGRLPAYVALFWAQGAAPPANAFTPSPVSPMGIMQGQTTSSGTLAIPPLGMGLGAASPTGF